MSFCWVTLRVQNMERSIDFYQDIVGLALGRRFNPGPETEIAFLGSNDSLTKVELYCDGTNPKPQYGRDFSLGFTVDSVEEKMTFLKEKKFENIEGPIQPNPNIRFIFILDPDGVRIQFVENIKA
jgi:lactoylglutathione lyase